MLIKNILLSNKLFGCLNPKKWPINFSDLPPGSALVGGSVRDGLLNNLAQKPDLDFVIPTDALEFSKKLSKKINASFVKLDEKRNIARVVVNGWTLDFARQVGKNLEDDLLRRDFRINAIALKLNQKPEIFDPTGGIEDLKRKKIVAISEKNLIDDPLRILRGFRLMCELHFELDSKTLRFLKTNVDKLSNVAPERIKTEILKIINSEWNSTVWQTYLELQLLKEWNKKKVSSFLVEQQKKISKNHLIGMPLAKLICLLSDEGLSQLTFSKNQIQKCKKLRFWVDKINCHGLENLSEDQRFQLHVDLEEDLPSLILFLNEKYINDWLNRWKDPSDPLFHPSSPLDGHLLQEALNITPGPLLGELMRHLSKEKAYGRFFTNQEALEVARKWTLQNSPFL